MRQKARTRWVKEGDCNSQYFHLIINWKCRYNMLRGVFAGGCWLEEPSRVKEETKQFFKRRFEEVEWERSRMDGDDDHLVACFEEEEEKIAMWDCGSAKSSKLDELNFYFIKEFWDILKTNVICFLDEFYANGSLLLSNNIN
ncbi:hypothetical protein GmHk_02G003008 [Glycine max]|nr:hypothetical protein GmHk_02G003008 [Glycine max]